MIDDSNHPNAKKALLFFRPYIESVEILKDNLVHKVYFCMSEEVSHFIIRIKLFIRAPKYGEISMLVCLQKDAKLHYKL